MKLLARQETRVSNYLRCLADSVEQQQRCGGYLDSRHEFVCGKDERCAYRRLHCPDGTMACTRPRSYMETLEEPT